MDAIEQFEHDTKINQIMREESVSREEAEAMWADYIQSEIEDGDWRKMACCEDFATEINGSAIIETHAMDCIALKDAR